MKHFGRLNAWAGRDRARIQHMHSNDSKHLGEHFLMLANIMYRKKELMQISIHGQEVTL